jgi:hypothetical protein
VIGTAIGAYALVDAWVFGPIVAILAATTSLLIVFAATAVVVLLLNLACCGWIERNWDTFMPANRERFEKRLERMRHGKYSGRLVDWITGGSDASFGVAAVLANAIIVVGAARLLGDRPVGGRRILVASVSYAIAFATLFCFVGWLVGTILGVATGQ